MNSSGLLRTLFSSVLALLLVGGVMTVQGQDVIVDEDEPDNPPTTFDTIAEGLDEIQDGELLVIRAGSYNEVVDLDPTTLSNLSAGDSFTIEARTDDDSGADAIAIDEIEVGDSGGALNVTVQSDGTGFLEVDASTGSDLTFTDGQLTLNATRDLQFTAGTIDVDRTANSSLVGNSPQFGGADVNATFDANAGDFDAGLEMPADVGGGIITVNGGGNDNTVTFPSGRFGSVTADRLVTASTGNAVFEGDLTTDKGFTPAVGIGNAISSNQSVTVDGAFTVTGTGTDNIIDVRSTGTDQVTLGSLTFSNLQNSETQQIRGQGILTVNGAATFQVAASNSGTPDDHVLGIDATASTSDFEFGSIVETSTTDGGSATDETIVDITNNAGGTIAVAGGTFRQLDQSSATTAGTFTVDGDVTSDVSSFPLLNGGDGATIQITGDNTFTLLNDGGGSVAHNNAANGGISGSGTVRFENVQGADDQTVNVVDNSSGGVEDVNRFPSVLSVGGNGLTLNGDHSSNGDGIVVNGDLQGGTSSTDGPVTLTTSGAGATATIGGTLEVNGGTTDLTGVLGAVSTTDVMIDNTGTLDNSGNRLEINRDFTRNTANATYTTTNPSSETAFIGSGSDGTFDTETLFTVNGRVEIDKTGATLSIPEAVTINGDLEIVDQGQFLETTLEVGDNLFLEGGGTFIVDSNFDAATSGSQVVFEGTSNYTVAGDDVLDNALVNFGNTGVDLLVNPNAAGVGNDQTLEFDGRIELRVGDINIVDSGDDFSPLANSDASIVRNLDGGGNQQILGAGTFNDLDNSYDLTYQGGAVDITALELTDGVRDLTVTESGTEVQLNSSAAPASPGLSDNNVTVSGVLTVTQGSDPAEIERNSNPQTIELTGAGVEHTILGEVNTGVTINAAGQNSTLQGNTDESASDVAELQHFQVSASGVTATNIQEIDGNLTVNSGGSLTLGMLDEQAIAGNVTANGDLTLASDVDVTSAGASVSIAGSAAATLDFQGNDLTLTSGTSSFSGTSDASYASSGGTLIFDGGGGQTFGTADVGVPRVDVNNGVTLTDASRVSEQLTVDATITSGGNDLTITGTADLNVATALTGAGALVAEATTVNANVDSDVSNFTVDSGGTDPSTLVQDGDADGNDDQLTVTNQLSVLSGTLENTTDVILTGNTAGPDEFVYAGGTITTPAGEFIQFDGGSNFTLDLQADATIPRLNITSTANFDDTDGESLTIGNHLLLQSNFNQTSNDGDLVIADGALIERRIFGGSGVLDREPVFAGQYDLEYSDSSNITSGLEVTTDPGTLRDLTIDFVSPLDQVEFTDTELSSNADAVVNGELTLQRGELFFDGTTGNARQVVMADGSTVRRFSGGSVGDPLAQPADPATFTLIYDGAGSFNASANEFLDTGRINLETQIDDGSAAFPNISVNVLPGDRTVQSVTVNNGTNDRTDLEDGSGTDFSLTVEGRTLVSSGVLAGGGTLLANGDVDVAGGVLSANANVEGDTEITNNGNISSGSYRTAGDFVVQSGNLGGSPAVIFDGDQQDLTFNSGAETFGSLMMDQQDGDSRVFLTGDQLNLTGAAPRLIFRDGLLVVPDSENQDNVFVNLSDPGNVTANVPIDHNPNTVSHVVGRVDVGIPAGTPQSGGINRGRFVFPVGSNPEYRPASFTLRTDDPIEVNVNITIGHVDENPGGTNGLGNIDGIAGYPDQHWFLTADQGLGSSQQFDLELETGTAGFVDRFEEAQELRIIRRFGDTANDWKLQGTHDSYDNNLFTKDGKEFTSVRTQESTGGVTQQEANFTIGLPGRIPAITDASYTSTSSSSSTAKSGHVVGTISENDTHIARFKADSRDPGQVVTLDTTDIPADAQEFITTIDQSTGTTSTDSIEVEFTPDNSFVTNGSRDVTLAVRAEDEDGFVDSTYTVTVNNVNRAPSFADTLPDTTITEQDSLTYTYTGTDPDGDALTFSLASSAPDNTTMESDGSFGFGPSFDQAGSTHEVVATVSDGEATVNDTAQVTVEYSNQLAGDASGNGEVSPQDASLALQHFLGKITLSPANARVSDVEYVSGDLELRDNGITAFDASQILAEAIDVDDGSSSIASKSIVTGDATGSLELKGAEQEEGTLRLPITLSEDARNVTSVSLTLEVGENSSVSTVASNLPEGWIADHKVQDDGTLKVGFAGTSALSSGQIGTIVLDGAEGDASDLGIKGSYELNDAESKSVTAQSIPDEFALNGNYPNPVKGETTIEYQLKKDADVKITVYDMLGRKVSTLVNKRQTAGTYTTTWDASGSGGSSVGSGVYFYRIEAGDFKATERMTVVR